jgi:hypothetical protein
VRTLSTLPVIFFTRRFWAVCLWAEESRFPDADCSWMKTGPNVVATTRQDQASALTGPFRGQVAEARHFPIRIEAAHRMAALMRSGARKASEGALTARRLILSGPLSGHFRPIGG